ncbi:MAG: DUF2066 domain-containing protein [Proteobacteria bacterium]|uniref:DUF2066 domain-containing protein n=1 Tax=Candidatus Avisuccinivibrio stercorigallinarum TaxID=2840704 RepID=A0A9D9GT43_9GAMM|nr:DUF2066 domain-containing protein [Candidatus Avisuccinivibrio stercorigallinarum]
MSAKLRFSLHLTAAAILAAISTQSSAALGAMGAVAAQSAVFASSAAANAAALQAGQDAMRAAEQENQEANAQENQNYAVQKPLSLGADEALSQSFTELLSSLSAGVFVPEAGEADRALAGASITADTITLTFDKAKVDELLNSQGIEAWQGLNTPIIVWMADESLTDKSLVDGEHFTYFAKALNNAAAGYQLRLMYPLMDLDDIMQVNEGTILSRNDAQLAAASVRYGADYILSAAVSDSDGALSVKWNLLDKNGTAVGGASLQGLPDETAQTVAGDLARSLMAVQSARAAGGDSGALAQAENEQADPNAPQRPQYADPNAADVFALGPYQGLVRVKILGAGSLADLRKIKRTLIIYGYEDTVSVAAVEDNALILEIPSNSDPRILDGTMARANDFHKEGAWTYTWLKGSGTEARSAGDIGPSTLRSAGSVSSVKRPLPAAAPAAAPAVQQAAPAAGAQSGQGTSGQAFSLQVISA